MAVKSGQIRSGRDIRWYRAFGQSWLVRGVAEAMACLMAQNGRQMIRKTRLLAVFAQGRSLREWRRRRDRVIRLKGGEPLVRTDDELAEELVAQAIPISAVELGVGLLFKIFLCIKSQWANLTSRSTRMTYHIC